MQDLERQRLPSLDRMLVFDAAARLGSFTLAGAEQHLTQSAVSRQIALLEAELGQPLFRRRHRAIELTPAGQRLAQAVAVALAGLREAVLDIRSPQRRQTLAVTTTPGFASLWLIPRLQDFTSAHPGIDVRIDATLEQRRLAGDGFDLAIRYARLDSAPGRALFAESIQPVCAPALLARGRPRLKQPQDLQAHTLLQVALPPGSAMPLEWQSWLQAAGAADVEPAAVLTFNNYDTAVAAALAGQGVVLGRRPLVDALLRDGALVAPFKNRLASARGYFLVTDPVAERRPAVHALVEWLLQQAALG